MTDSNPAKRPPRIEDEALVTGKGRFSDDSHLPGQAYAAFVRSPHAHARIRSVNTEEAKKAKGVLAVLTAADMQDAGVTSLSRHPPFNGRNGTKLATPFRPALAGEMVRFVGEGVAMVVAETLGQAYDAADLVVVDYEELQPVVDLREAMEANAPQLHDDAPGNLVIDWPGPVPSDENEQEVAKIIAEAPHVARVTVTNQRMVVASMETRGATGVWDKENQSYVLHACSQSAGALHGQGTAIMGVPGDKLRVFTDDVGGAFGMKTPFYPEYACVLVGARKTGRPVHWQSTRSEAFLTDTQARDTVTEAELAMDASGKFLALRMRHLCNQGGYVSPAGANINTNNFARCLPGMYRIPKVVVTGALYFTNTAPIGPYRGAGRPEANYALERVVEEAARVVGMDPVRLRKKNFIPKSAMPCKTAVGNTYDSGDFPGIVDQALQMADYANFNKRKRESAKRKKLRGIGVSCMLEHAGAMPTETASLTFTGDSKLVMGLNVQSTGQSHATVFGRMVAERLGIDPKTIVHKHGDSGMQLPGFASVGSRSAMCAGAALVKTVEAVIEKGKKAASHLLETSESDIQFRNGGFEVVGTDRKIGLFETAHRAKVRRAEGEEPDHERGLREQHAAVGGADQRAHAPDVHPGEQQPARGKRRHRNLGQAREGAERPRGPRDGAAREHEDGEVDERAAPRRAGDLMDHIDGEQRLAGLEPGGGVAGPGGGDRRGDPRPEQRQPRTIWSRPARDAGGGAERGQPGQDPQ